MKALRISGPGKASIEEISLTDHVAGNTLLRVRMVGMCGSDLTTFLGKNPMVSYPRILGHEIAATVVEPGNSGLAVGTDVTLSPYTACENCPSCLRGRPNTCQFNQTMGVQRDGAMTEFISVPAERLYPADLPIEVLALVEPLTIGAHAVSRGRITEEDVVAVFGCGGVGLGAIAAAAYRGATVIAIDKDDKKLEIARKAGAARLLHSGREDLHSTLSEWTYGRGPDVVIEAIGLPSTFVAAVQEVAFAGRVVYIGYTKEPVAYETRLFVQKELDVLGSRNAQPEDFRFVIKMLSNGEFPAAEAVSIVGSLEDAPRLLTEWAAEPTRFTKILITLD